jgi:hypothetical protein
MWCLFLTTATTTTHHHHSPPPPPPPPPPPLTTTNRRYSVRGAVWFQGEHNVVTGTSRERYACIFKGMINDWRDAWTGIGDFPFLWAQLAPYTG